MTAHNLVDEMDKRFLQLDAAMTLTWGNDETEGIRGLSEDVRDAFMWGVHTQIRDLRRLYDTLKLAVRQEKQNAPTASSKN